jgi:hypothetical protein
VRRFSYRLSRGCCIPQAKQLEMESSKKGITRKVQSLESQLSENDVETMSLAITNLLHFLFGRKRISIFTHYRTKRSRH